MQLAPVPHSFLEHFFTFGPQVFQARPVLSLAQPGVDHSSNDLDCFLGENGTLKTGAVCVLIATGEFSQTLVSRAEGWVTHSRLLTCPIPCMCKCMYTCPLTRPAAVLPNINSDLARATMPPPARTCLMTFN